ncbi:MAG TPA: AAA family ATPase [Polyangiaceae bacterium]|nr:AAA family ATPase [Polyangiaceae bacterium]
MRTKAAQLRVVDGAQPPRPADPLAKMATLRKHALVGSDDLLAEDEPAEWIWQGVVQAHDHVELSGPSYSGKTTAAFLIAAAMANPGEPIELFGRLIAPMAAGRRALVVSVENSVSSAKRKLRESVEMLGLPVAETLDRVILIARGAPIHAHLVGRDDTGLWAESVALARTGAIGLTVLDSRARVLTAADSRDETEAAQAQAAIHQMTEASGAPVLVVSHTRKGQNGQRGDLSLEDVSGSLQRAAGADVVLLASADRNPDGSIGSTRLVVAKRRDDGGEEHPLPMTFAILRAAGGRPMLSAESAPRPEDQPTHERVFELLRAGGHRSKAEMREALNLSGASLEKALSVLFAAKRIVTTDQTIHGRRRTKFGVRVPDGELFGDAK